MTANVDTFVENLTAIQNSDYGDFMRAANLYLNHLRQELHRQFAGTLDASMECKLDKMQEYLQYTPSWDINETRQRLLADVKFIDDLVMGHKQDWESESLH